MHIHEVIIDGFKSYAKQTVISGFDPQFNAITGLNGTGKSNILDAICFVLGISNLSQVITLIFSGMHVAIPTRKFQQVPYNYRRLIFSQVRASSIQELVYKQGQAGVTKASVTVIFNNPDPNNSPIGFESHKQITVTRQVNFQLTTCTSCSNSCLAI